MDGSGANFENGPQAKRKWPVESS